MAEPGFLRSAVALTSVVWYLVLHRAGSGQEKHQEIKQLYIQMFWIYQHARFSHWTSADIWLKILFLSPDVSDEVLASFIINLFLICLLCVSDRPYKVVLLSLANFLSFINILLDLETSEHRIWVAVSQAADSVHSFLRIHLKFPRFGFFTSRGESLVCRKPTMTSGHVNSVVFCLVVLLYLQLHQHWYSAGFPCNNCKFHYRS